MLHVKGRKIGKERGGIYAQLSCSIEMITVKLGSQIWFWSCLVGQKSADLKPWRAQACFVKLKFS